MQAEAASEGSHEYYEDVNSLLKARKRTHSSNAGVTVAVYYVQVGVKGSTESEFLTNITQYKSQASSTAAAALLCVFFSNKLNPFVVMQILLVTLLLLRTLGLLGFFPKCKQHSSR